MRGQTSIEVLLVVSFVILLALAISLPFIENQNRTNASIAAKLGILPYLEKNNLRIRLQSIAPEFLPPDDLRLVISSSGVWSTSISEELFSTLGGAVSGCQQICSSVHAVGGYSSINLVWYHDGVLECDTTCSSSACGNGLVDALEACDPGNGGNFGGATCSSLLGSGFGGSLACVNSCQTINTSSCVLGGGSPYSPVDIISVSLSPAVVAPLAVGGSTTLTTSLSLVPGSLAGYSEMSTLQVNVLCRINSPGDACDAITANQAGYDSFVTTLGTNPSIFIESSLHLLQMGSTSGDVIIPSVFSGIQSQFPSASVQNQSYTSDLDLVPLPVNYSYVLNPTAMGLSPGTYKFISISHKGHFNYSQSNPPVLNGEELPSFQGNNIRVLPITITP